MRRQTITVDCSRGRPAMRRLQPTRVQRRRSQSPRGRPNQQLRPMRAHSLLRSLKLAGKPAEAAFPFQEVVIRSVPTWVRRGKSGHHRAGFPAKAGGARFKAGSRPVPQKTNRLLWEVRVKRWGKSPPPQERSSGQCKPNPMQDEIGDRAARPMIPGTSHLASAGTEATSVDE